MSNYFSLFVKKTTPQLLRQLYSLAFSVLFWAIPFTAEAQITNVESHLLDACELEIVIDDLIFACDGTDVCIEILNGTAPYTITIDGPNTPNTEDNIGLCFFDLQPGSYSISVVDGEGCSASVQVDIPVIDYYVEAQVTNVSCAGGTEGAIQLIIPIDIAPLYFSWEGPDGFTADTESISSLEAGIYSVSVSTTDDICVGVGSWELTEPDPIEIEVELNYPTCGQPDGCLYVSGGTAPYYIWILETLPDDLANAPSGTLPPLVDLDPNQGFPYNPLNSDTAICGTNVAAGTYFILVVDSQLCYAWESLTIEDNPVTFDRHVETTDVTCHGANDGSICYSIVGGEPPYQSYLSPASSNIALQGPEGCFENLPPGDYILTTTDGSGCTLSEQFTITEPNELRAEFEITSQDCGDQVDGCLTVEGGTLPYHIYVFTHPDPTIDHIDVTFDANGLPVIADAEMIDWFDLGPNTDPNYEQCAEDIPAGNYLIVVVDANGCFVLLPVIIPDNNGLEASFEITDQDCDGVDGCLTVEGGTGPYRIFVWTHPNPGQDDYEVVFDDAGNPIITGAIPIDYVQFYPNPDTTPNEPFTRCAENIPPGFYLVLVVDANGCYVLLPIIIPDHNGLVLETEVEDVSCYGEADGSVILHISGGIAPYTIVFDNESSNPTDNSLSVQFHDLAAGTYNITVYDAQQCSASLVVTVGSPDPLVSNLEFDTYGAFACVDPSGGTTPYSVSWYDFSQNAAFSSDFCVYDLVEGAYLVTIQDANACQTEDILIIDPFVCAGGEASVSPEVIESGEQTTFTLSNYGAASIQWQFKTEFTPWLDIPGATTDSYLTAPIHTGTDKEILVRAEVICPNGDVLYSTEALLKVMANNLLIPIAALTEDPQLFNPNFRKAELATLPDTRTAFTFIYPTITRDEIKVHYEFNTTEAVKISVLNQLGQPIQTSASQGIHQEQHTSLSAKNWGSGTYFIRIESEFGIQTHRVIVQ